MTYRMEVREPCVICRNCQFQNLKGRLSCLHCRLSLRRAQLSCPTCTTPASAGMIACDNCGQPFLSRERLDEYARTLDDKVQTHQWQRSKIQEQAELPPPRKGSAADPRSTARIRSEGKVVAWLSCDPLPPLPLGPKPVVSLGRSRKCDMVLPHDAVSRLHVLIRVVGKGIFLDDRSRFGTAVNGRQAPWAKLNLGDRIRVGPYILRVMAHEEKANMTDTRPLTRVAIANLA